MRVQRPLLWIAGTAVMVVAVAALASMVTTRDATTPPPGAPLTDSTSSGGQAPLVAAGSTPAPAGAATDAGALVRYVVVAEESEARYRVGETFLRFERPNVAVGATRAISGEILLAPGQPAASRLGTFTVDISQLRSDEPRRDQAIRERWLQSARFPIARFEATSIEVGEAAGDGGDGTPVTLHGHLTVRDVTRPVTFEGTFRLEGDILRASARTTVRMTDFGFEPPSIAGLLRADDEVQIEVDLVARPSAQP